MVYTINERFAQLQTTEFCAYSEADITIVFGTIIEGSNPSRRTRMPRFEP